MKRIKIDLGGRCNSDCIFCAVGDQRNYNLTHIEFREILDALPENLSHIILTGGEPTIREDIFEILRDVKEKGVQTVIVTNGIRISDISFARKIAVADVNEYVVSLHSHIKQTQERINRTNGSHEHIVRGISNLLALGQKVSLNCVITRMNFNQLVEYSEWCMNAFSSLRRINFTYPFIMGNGESSYHEFLVEYDELKAPLRDVATYFENAKRHVFFSNIPPCVIDRDAYQYVVRNDVGDSHVKCYGPKIPNTLMEKRRKLLVNARPTFCESCPTHKKNSCFGIQKQYFSVYPDERGFS